MQADSILYLGTQEYMEAFCMRVKNLGNSKNYLYSTKIFPSVSGAGNSLPGSLALMGLSAYKEGLIERSG